MKSKKRVVVTGIGIICSLGAEKHEVIDNMKKNKTGIGPITRFSTDKFISQIGAEVKDYTPEKYFSVQERNSYDYCSQFGIIAAKEALAESGIEITQENSHRFGVAFGTCNGGINSLEEQATVTELDMERTSRYPFYQQGDNIAMHFGLHGPVNTLNTACAASGNAIGFAYDMITEGYADTMLAGGSDSMSSSVYAGFNVLQALNPVPCSPYNNKFGLSLGEGAAFVVLESLESALERGANIYAEVCGYGLSSDAYHETAPEPEGRGIQLAVEFALINSGVSKDRIDYINTHGTGTKANDSAELYGLRKLFGEERFNEILVSSSKAYFGHNLGAAAAIEYVTTLLALKDGLLPATLHFDSPREGVNTVNLITNEMRKSSVQYFLCNNSAFGGHNASIVSYNWTNGERIVQETEIREPKRVGVVGMGTVSGFGHCAGTILPWLLEDGASTSEESFSLKEYNKDLYERRMNQLSQNSIGAAHLALQDSGVTIEGNQQEIGLFYGTSRGSLESAQKYLTAIFEKGPDHASGVYFPDMVLNSTAGKIAKKLGLKGYGTSLSTGGNDGLISALYGYETIRAGIQKYGLIGAGDERSSLSSKVDSAIGLDRTPYEIGEGSAFLVIMDLEQAQKEGREVYAELKGFGTAFSGSQDSNGEVLKRVVEMALSRSGLGVSGIDFVLFNNIDGIEETTADMQALNELFADRKVPVLSLNDRFGYCESTGSLFHLTAAVDALRSSKLVPAYALEAAAASSLESIVHEGGCGLVVSSSLNGNYTAGVVAQWNK